MCLECCYNRFALVGTNYLPKGNVNTISL